MTMMRLRPRQRERSSSSSGPGSLLPSSIRSTRSALSMAALLRSIPSISTLSSECLIPAVSTKLTLMPLRLALSSTVSLVVPGISVTMLRSSLRKRFKSEDFPTFGRPMRAIFTPSRIILPSSAEARSSSSSSFIADKRFLRSSYMTSSISSSG